MTGVSLRVKCPVKCPASLYSSVYLAKLLDHLLDADVSVLGDLALHVGEPLAQLLVPFVEYSPLIQLLTHLLPAQ